MQVEPTVSDTYGMYFSEPDFADDETKQSLLGALDQAYSLCRGKPGTSTCPTCGISSATNY
jgi:hypothetical protein